MMAPGLVGQLGTTNQVAGTAADALTLVNHHLNRGKGDKLHGFEKLFAAENSATRASVPRLDTVERMQFPRGLWKVLGSAAPPAALGLPVLREFPGTVRKRQATPIGVRLYEFEATRRSRVDAFRLSSGAEVAPDSSRASNHRAW